MAAKPKKEEAQPASPQNDIPIEVPEPKMFTMIRRNDESGVSGVGRVLDGWVTHNGKVIICWRTDIAESSSVHGHSSIAVYDSFKAFSLIHINSHPDNGTELLWYEVKKLKIPEK